MDCSCGFFYMNMCKNDCFRRFLNGSAALQRSRFDLFFAFIFCAAIRSQKREKQNTHILRQVAAIPHSRIQL